MTVRESHRVHANEPSEHCTCLIWGFSAWLTMFAVSHTDKKWQTMLHRTGCNAALRNQHIKSLKSNIICAFGC